jgi:multiple sugar transport system permease protein
VPLRLVFALAIAMLMNQKHRLTETYRVIYYLPSIISGVPLALLWSWILHPEFGILNLLLWQLFHVRGPRWLFDTRTALPSLILMSLWGVGGSMLIYLAGLQGIPSELQEAAEIDGANPWQRFRNITLPLITPVIFFNLVTGVIQAFQTFTQAFVMTGGGPKHATRFYLLHLYQYAFTFFRMGYASALAWVLFILILALTLLIFRFSSAWVFYQGEVRR